MVASGSMRMPTQDAAIRCEKRGAQDPPDHSWEGILAHLPVSDMDTPTGLANVVYSSHEDVLRFFE